jgi:hypothetical protein
MNESPAIGWLPIDAGYDRRTGEPLYIDGCPLTTFGPASDLEAGPGTDHPDPEIADLVRALDAAGIETAQSSQDITTWLRKDGWEDVARMGMVLVRWDSFPKIKATLPDYWDDDGWLFAADPACKYVSVIFPWRAHDAWLAKLRRAKPQVSLSELRQLRQLRERARAKRG